MPLPKHLPSEQTLVNVLLILSVLRQLRGRRLTWFGLLWPIAIVVAAAFGYLHGFPTGETNILMVVTGGCLGAVLGGLCGWFSQVYPDSSGHIIVRATGAAALLWTVGTGSRLAFELFAQHGGYPAIVHFDERWDIHGVQTWATCLIAMALAEVLARTSLLASRLARMSGSGRQRVSAEWVR